MVTDSKIGPHEISREIQKRNLNKTIVVGENLSYEDEKITIGKPEDILAVEKFDMNVVVILDEEQGFYNRKSSNNKRRSQSNIN